MVAVLLGATASAQNDYFHDIGATNEVWGGSFAHTCWIQMYDAVGGADTITEVLTCYGSPTFPNLMVDGVAAQVMLYEDPNDDGNPNDAVLLWSTQTTSANSNTDILNSYTVNPPQAVSGKFFVAAVVDHTVTPRWPAPRDTTQNSNGRAWMCRNNNVNIPFDIQNLAANDFPPTDMDTLAGGPAVFRIQANGLDSGPIGMNDPTCDGLIVPNSTGQTGDLSLVGTALAGDPVMATVSSGPPSQFGYVVTGPSAGLYIVPPGSQGFICVGAPQFRYDSLPLGQIFQFDSAGISQAVAGGGPSILPTDGSYAPVPAVTAGTSRIFQAWYRDTNPAPTSNFTDAPVVMFN
ncbi:MAG: hypothetical protein GY711_22995 [bacterium]|nr:hypothetical protein [bacterium]